jgi:N-formylglutamate amidohydrolase
MVHIQQKDFVLTVENTNSPIIITVPHGGMKQQYASWLETFFQARSKSEIPEENIINGQRVVLGGDGQILHIVMDIIKSYSANVIVGLLPRKFVDYNRFVPELAYADEKIRPYYDAYHQAIADTIKRLQANTAFGDFIFLFDFHGFGRQPIEGIEFDIILGTNGVSSPAKSDHALYEFFKTKYTVFCVGKEGLSEESELYKGDTTNLYYHTQYGIDGVLVEIAPKFRSSKIAKSKENGIAIATHFADFFRQIDNRIHEMQMDWNDFQNRDPIAGKMYL